MNYDQSYSKTSTKPSEYVAAAARAGFSKVKSTTEPSTSKASDLLKRNIPSNLVSGQHARGPSVFRFAALYFWKVGDACVPSSITKHNIGA